MKVVIIGGGVAGLGAGWRLAQAGIGVTLLERAQPGSGASHAAAGMIAVSSEFADAPSAEISFAKYSNGLWPSFVVELEAGAGRTIGYRRNGALLVVRDAAERAALLAAHTDASISWLEPGEARTRVPMLTGEYEGALWAPDEAQVDNRALVQALAIAFRRAGGTLVANEAVIRIERRGGRAAIAHTAFGLYEADGFILAAGAWSGLIEEAIPITPVKGEMIALGLPHGEALPDPVTRGGAVYAVPRGDRLLIGATMEEQGFNTSISTQARDRLRAAAEALMPPLRHWPLLDHWAGLRPRTPDDLPVLGPTRTDGLFVAGGQFRNGILFAPAIAEHMRDLLLGRAAVIPAFDPRRFA